MKQARVYVEIDGEIRAEAVLSEIGPSDMPAEYGERYDYQAVFSRPDSPDEERVTLPGLKVGLSSWVVVHNMIFALASKREMDRARAIAEVKGRPFLPQTPEPEEREVAEAGLQRLGDMMNSALTDQGEEPDDGLPG